MQAWQFNFRLLLLLVLAAAPVAWCAAGMATPQDYGAIADDALNDAPAFQSALNTEKTVWVPAGQYHLQSQLQVPAGGALIGEGTLVIDWDPAGAGNAETAAAILLIGNNTRVEGLTIRKTFVDGSYGTGILANRRNHINLLNLRISGYSARYGIHLIECQEFRISRCHVMDFMMDTTADMISDSPAGIRITRSIRGSVRDNMITRIEVGPTGRASISPLIPSYGAQGYQSDGITMMQCRDVAVIGNSIQTSGEGIDMLLSESCTVVGNVVRDMFMLGFKVLGTSFCAINSNVVEDCFQGTNMSPGALSTFSYGNAYHANMLHNTGNPGSFGPVARPGFGGERGVFIETASGYNMVTENLILDTQVVKTQIAGVTNQGGATNRVADNTISTALTYGTTQPYEYVPIELSTFEAN